jgi:hypothetical protein
MTTSAVECAGSVQRLNPEVADMRSSLRPYILVMTVHSTPYSVGIIRMRLKMIKRSIEKELWNKSTRPRENQRAIKTNPRP